MKPRYDIRLHVAYDYGGDTGPCTLIDETLCSEIDDEEYAKLLRDIDELGAKIRAHIAGTGGK